jgi:hypothetical protein
MTTYQNPTGSPSQANRYKMFNLKYAMNSTQMLSFVTDWYMWKYSYIDACFAGIVPYTPTGFEDYIEFSCLEDLSYTRVYSGSFNDLTSILGNCLCNNDGNYIDVVTNVRCGSASGSGSGLIVGKTRIKYLS